METARVFQPFPREDQGPVSISDNASCRKILWSLETTPWTFGNTAADVHVEVKSDRTILNRSPASSRLCEIFHWDV